MPTNATFSAVPQFPRGLIGTLITERQRGRPVAIEPYELPDVNAWLCYLGADWDALVRHVELLKKWLPDETFGDPLPPDVVAAVREGGPAAIADPAVLAELLINANQLIQFHELAYGDDPGGTGPSDFWVGVIDRVARLSTVAEPARGSALAAGAGAMSHHLLAMTNDTAFKPGQTARALGLGLDAEGEALKRAILARCYGPEAEWDEPFALTLNAESVAGDADRVRLYLTVSPAPVLAPLELTVAFAGLDDTPAVEFVIPAYPDGRQQASSVSSDPLPRAAFEFGEGEWANQLPLRLTVRGEAPPPGGGYSRLVRELTFSAEVPLLD